MFNLREPERHSVSQAMTTMTAATSSIPAPTTMLLHTLTKVEDVDESTDYEPWNHPGGLFHDVFFCGHLILTIEQK